jgi:hypothetical protein
MQELIDMIRIATANDATQEQKAAGVQACRTIATALNCEPGKPLAIGPQPQTTSRISIDQVLDLMIAKLTVVAKDRGDDDAKLIAAPTPKFVAPVVPHGLRVPTNAVPAAKKVQKSDSAAARKR